MRTFRAILATIGLLSTPSILIMAWTNPLLENYNLFYAIAFVWIVLLSMFAAESITGKLTGEEE